LLNNSGSWVLKQGNSAFLWHGTGSQPLTGAAAGQTGR